jgi:cysteinyl-tRNA synthetase
MALQIYSSLTRRKEPFEPADPNKVGMYVCGPTVYDDCHVGHVVGPLVFDTIAKWLKAKGYGVDFVNNITDIDDKIIHRSLKTGEPWLEITKRYTQQYFDILNELNVTEVSSHPKCSDFIPQMIEYIKDLVDRNKAYQAEDGVYFDVAQQKGYGKLSSRKLEDMQEGSRIEVQGGLRHPADFCLWKYSKAGEPSWESPWGAGRPGWHIECSVMSCSLLGDTFDIHGGGDDLKFPHHENEIAQGEAHGGDYAKLWMHNGLIQYEGVKVGKSDPRMKDPNFSKQFNVFHIFETYGSATLRFLILQGHYRRPFDFAPQAFESAKKALDKLLQAIIEYGDMDLIPITAENDLLAMPLPAECVNMRREFCNSMDNDFNSGAAMGHMFSMLKLVKNMNNEDRSQVMQVIQQMNYILGITNPKLLNQYKEKLAHAASGGNDKFEAVMRLLIECRQRARINKDFELSDHIRDELQKAGLVLLDGKDGTSWEQKD